MKKKLFISGLLFLSLWGYSQSAYHGGRGDGYAFAEILLPNAGVSDCEIVRKVFVYPNPIKSGQNIHCKVTLSYTADISVYVRNLMGDLIYKTEVKAVKKNVLILKPIYFKGIYFICLQSPNWVENIKIIVY